VSAVDAAMKFDRRSTATLLSASTFQPRRVLLVSPNPIGDAVMAEPAMRAIARRFSHARIDILVTGSLAALGQAMPFAHRVVHMATGAGAGARLLRLRLLVSLTATRYDLCVLFPNSLSSARVAYFAGIPRISGYARNGRDRYLSDPLPWSPAADDCHMIDYYGRIAEQLGCEDLISDGATRPCLTPDPRVLDTSARVLADRGCRGSYVVLAPGAAYGGAKRWPARHYAALARELNRRSGHQIVLAGGPDDRTLGQQIVAMSGLGPPALIVLCGETDLSTSLGIIAGCAGFVGNDSGPAHIAAALGRPGVTLFGSSSIARSGPVGARMRPLARSVPCSPCLARECPLGHFECLTDLMPDQVADALQAAIESRTALANP
jgi:heptosyltransferase-2